MNKIVSLFLFLTFLISCTVVSADTVTMYTPDGRKTDVWDTEVNKFTAMGWEKEPVSMVYSPDSKKTSVIYKSELQSYLDSGWVEESVITMYSPDGDVATTWKSQQQTYKKAGWYDVPVVRMYADGGKVCVISASEIDLYRNVGWYPLYAYAPGKSSDEITKTFGTLVDYSNDFNSPVFLTDVSSEIDAGFVFSGQGQFTVKSGFAGFGTIFPYLSVLSGSDGTLSTASLSAFFGTQIQGANGALTFVYDGHTFTVSANSQGNITMNSVCAYN